MIDWLIDDDDDDEQIAFNVACLRTRNTKRRVT